MTIHFGGVPAGSVLPIFFGSYDSAGASATLSGLAVTDIEIYKGVSITQRASDAGYTLIDTDGIDVDSTTGLNAFSIDTGDNTDAGFYAAGSFYTVVVSAVTIDSQTVNFIAATFRIVAAESTAGTPNVHTASLSANAITATAINADAITAAKVAADVSAEIADAVWDEDATGHQSAGTFGLAIGDPGASSETLYKAIVTDPAGTNLAADVIAIKAETAAILADTDVIGSTGQGLTTLATAAALDAVDNFVDTEIGAIITALGVVSDNVDDLEAGIIYGAAATGTLATTSMTTDLTGYADDQLIGRVVIFLDGDCEGEGSPISDYAETDGVVTFTNELTTAPGDGDLFKIV